MNNNNQTSSFKNNLIRARSHIIFILALITAFALVISLDKASFENRVVSKANVEKVTNLQVSATRIKG